MRSLFAALIAIALGSATGMAQSPASGLQPGEEVSAWEPVHVAGPHAGTKTCPVCTYLEAPMLLAFARDIPAAAELAGPLEAIAKTHAGAKLKVILVVETGSSEELQKLARDHAIANLMLCRPDPERRDKQLRAYKIDSSVANIVLLYRNYTVTRNWTALPADHLSELKSATDVYLPNR
jgi:protocatechuate 3,4-dioxygenase, beta subunit